jgi:hypothetical protein
MRRSRSCALIMVGDHRENGTPFSMLVGAVGVQFALRILKIRKTKNYSAISKIVVISVNSRQAFFSKLASLAALYLFLCRPIS